VLLVAFVCIGCASNREITNKKYREPVENAMHIYEIRFILADGSFFKFFSVMKPNAFYIPSNDTGLTFIIYFQDVRGQDVYIPQDVLTTIDIKDYNVKDDIEKYFYKRKEIQEYYEQKIRQ
jgi:hypothetical protein